MPHDAKSVFPWPYDPMNIGVCNGGCLMKKAPQNKEAAVLALCERYRVTQLELFGSGPGEDFAPGHSDLDLLVRFQACTPEEDAERYLGVLAQLQELFGCSIDLVEIEAVRNPVTVHGVQNAKTVGKPHFSDHKSSHFAAFSRRSPAAIAKTPMFFGGQPRERLRNPSVIEHIKSSRTPVYAA